jgi:hypothetical protein
MRIHLNLFAFLASSTALLATPPPPTADSLNSGLSVHVDHSTEAFLLSWWGIDQHFYFIEHSVDLVNWSFVPIFEAGDDDVLTWGFNSDADKMFFRARYTDDPESPLMQSDLDGDGLTVYQEYLIGSDPFNPDTAGDGIFDGIAYKLGLPVVYPGAPAPDPFDNTPPTIHLATPASATLLP